MVADENNPSSDRVQNDQGIGRFACTVVVASCDRYADLQQTFIRLFRKFWPDCPFEVVLVTETDLHVAGFDRTIACGGGTNWASRLVMALDQVRTPQVMMLCDDYFLASPVDTKGLLGRLDEMLQANAVNLRLIPNPKNGLPRGKGLMEYPKDTAYCIATQAGFWNREFLQRLARGKSSIWEFERYGSFEVGGETRPILATVKKEFPFVDAVHKGHWERFGVRVCEENGIVVDFSKRGLPPLSARIKESLKALVFAVVPNTLIVRVQNAFGLGAKERK